MENPVKIWMHVGLVLSNGEKMSKSLGNVVWSRDLVQMYGQNLLRLYLFSTHYRDDIDFNEHNLATKKNLLEKILITSSKTSYETDGHLTNLIDEFFKSLDDDLDSPKAIEMFEKICTKVIDGGSICRNDFDHICRVLGIEL
ncbi:Cysteine--tRNA ligase [uncultured archaeon]|nr:Cysteine--tRNA ligase [uncultured archaeon]